MGGGEVEKDGVLGTEMGKRENGIGGGGGGGVGTEREMGKWCSREL